MKKNMLIPAMALPIKPTEDIDTQRMPVAIIKDPTTPIPPALTKPFFSGQMPLPPSTNMAYKIGYVGGHPRIIPTVALEIFKADAAFTLANSRYSTLDNAVVEAIRTARIKTPLSVSIRAYFSTEWKRDLDGVVKFAIDAAFAYLHINDNQVVRLDTEKLVDPDAPRVEIEICCVAR